MGGIGVIKDWDKFSKWLEDLETRVSDKWDLPKIGKIDGWDVKESDTHYIVSLPENGDPEVLLRKEDLDKIGSDVPDWYMAKRLLNDEMPLPIAMFSIGNDEGDSSFWNGSDMDYDIDFDYFDDIQREIYDGFGEENGIVFVDKRYGAGRNG